MAFPLRRLSTLALTSTLFLACGEDGSGDAGTPPGPQYLPADGVAVKRVAFYQGLERDLAVDGAAATDSLPIVAGREAMLRVFYATDDAYDGNPVLARLTITDTGEAAGDGGGSAAPATPTEKSIDLATTLGVESTQENLASTLNFEVPGDLLTPTSSFRVDVLRAAAQSSGANVAASYPATGGQPFQATSVGARMRVVLVPIRYQSDGSGRLPDTSPEQLEIYRRAFLGTYPVPEVDIRVAEPYDWKGIKVLGTGQGWGELLNAIVQHRQSSTAEFDEYYYGIFRANETFEQFCGGGCIAGLSQVATSPSNDFARAGIGMGFSGAGVAETAIHEVGHQHGRGHVPCGTNQGVDPGFPHPQGAIGRWGYDLFAKQLVPAEHKDFMSYCGPKWVSDFTFQALLTRVQAVNSVVMMDRVGGAAAPAPARYERVAIGMDGRLTWLEPLTLARPPVGDAEPVDLEGPSGRVRVTGQFLPYSHLPGGVVYFASPGSFSRLTIRGRSGAR